MHVCFHMFVVVIPGQAFEDEIVQCTHTQVKFPWWDEAQDHKNESL